MKIFTNITQFDFVKIFRKQNETAPLEEGIIPAGLFLSDSGTHTPTVSGVTNDATVSITDCFYVKVGKWANLSFVLDVQMDAAASNTSFNVSLPFTTNGISVLNCSPQSAVIDNIISTATGASVNIAVQSLNTGDNIEKLEVSINFFLA